MLTLDNIHVTYFTRGSSKATLAEAAKYMPIYAGTTPYCIVNLEKT